MVKKFNEYLKENIENENQSTYEYLFSMLYDILDINLETRNVPYSDDIDIDPQSKESAVKNIIIFLKEQGYIK